MHHIPTSKGAKPYLDENNAVRYSRNIVQRMEARKQKLDKPFPAVATNPDSLHYDPNVFTGEWKSIQRYAIRQISPWHAYLKEDRPRSPVPNGGNASLNKDD